MLDCCLKAFGIYFHSSVDIKLISATSFQLSRVDCRDALEMICNLEADGDEKAAFTLCSGFLTRQILQEDSYCAWQVTNVTNARIIYVEPGNYVEFAPAMINM